MQSAIEKLATYPKIAVWVLKENQKAIEFYEKYGFRFDGVEMDVLMGSSNTELRMILNKG